MILGIVLVVGATVVTSLSLVLQNDDPPLGSRHRIFFAAGVAPDHGEIFSRHFTGSDMVRIDTLPSEVEVPRSQTYALVTTLRRRWAGFLGLAYFLGRGCGSGSPGTIVYDPERRDLTPINEQNHLLRSIGLATKRVNALSCHEFGLSPGATLLFGLDPTNCTYDLEQGIVEEIDWRRVDVVDVQAQRLLGESCLEKDGLDSYESAVTSVAEIVRRQNPDIDVLAQVSFRDNEPETMIEGLRSVADVIDGIYFSYPTVNPEIPCGFCTLENLEEFLSEVR